MFEKNWLTSNIDVRCIRMNGGAASYVTSVRARKRINRYNDLDLIFGVDLSKDGELLDIIRDAVFECLLNFPSGGC